MSSNKKSTSGILNKAEWGQCDTRPMSDTERLRYGKAGPNTTELREILKSPIKTRQYQNTYGVSDADIVAIRNCISQQVYEKNLYAKAEAAVAEEDEIEVIPVGLIVR